MAVGYRDYYEILGIGRDADEEEIRRTYRRLARQYHPDVNREPGAEDRFKEISEAYEVLRDPEKRERYDRLGANWQAGDDVSSGAGFDDVFGGGFSGFGGFGDAGGTRVEFGTGEFSDFFESLFGRRGAARPGAGAGRGSDQEAEIELTLEEAAAGGERRITLGDGREYRVTIPAGVGDGQRIRLAGEGGRGRGDGPSGDLYLRVRLRPHKLFRLEGRDLHVDLPLAPWEAALGATVEVPTLRGNARVKVPAGSSCGRRLRVRGEGMPAKRGRGDLYASVRIDVPRKPNEKERSLFRQLAQESHFDARKDWPR
jgi:curved DNA-binding protein